MPMKDAKGHGGELEPSERASLKRTGRFPGSPKADDEAEAAIIAAARAGYTRAKERLVEVLMPRLLRLVQRLARSGADVESGRVPTPRPRLTFLVRRSACGFPEGGDGEVADATP
jgi:hypothetical protein